jgi:hypothetical protein
MFRNGKNWIGFVAFASAAFLFAIGCRRESRRNYEINRDWGFSFVSNLLIAVDQLPPPTITDSTSKPLYSWRFFIEPDFGRLDHETTSKEWKSISHLFTDSNPAYCFHGTEFTHLLAVVGDGTAFSDRAKLSEISANTIILIEKSVSSINWMEPGDVDIGDLAKTSGAEFQILRDFAVTFADGEVWLLSQEVPSELVAKHCRYLDCPDRMNALSKFVVRKISDGPEQE